MSTQEIALALQKVKKANENITIAIGITIGVILVTYFFTFAMLIDKGASGVIKFQIVSSILMVYALFFLKKIGFFVTKLLLGNQSRYKVILDSLELSDLSLDEQTLLNKFS